MALRDIGVKERKREVAVALATKPSNKKSKIVSQVLSGLRNVIAHINYLPSLSEYVYKRKEKETQYDINWPLKWAFFIV